jgi:Rieske Fe-S protein
MSTRSPDVPAAEPRQCAGQCECAGGEAYGVGRRDFLSQAVLAAASLALAACGGGGDGPTAPSNVTGTVRVADHAALATVNGIALVTVDGAQLAIVRTGATSFVALSRICPHQGNLINISGNGFLCSGHGAQFTATGTWRGGQQTTNMRSYPTSYDAGTDILTIG